MTVTVTVTSDTPSGEIVRLAEYLLSMAGYKAPVIGAAGSNGAQAQASEQDGDVALNVNGVLVPGWGGDTTPAPTLTPNTPQAAFAAHPPGVDVDKEGYPWDSRIHSSSREKIADGTWRQRRNLDPNVKAAVQAELRKVMGAPAPAPAPEPTNVIPLPPPFVPSVVVPPPPPTITPPPTVPAGAAPAASPGSFTALMTAVTKAFTVDKSITQDDLLKAVKSVGLESLPNLMSRPDLIPTVALMLGITL